MRIAKSIANRRRARLAGSRPRPCRSQFVGGTTTSQSVTSASTSSGACVRRRYRSSLSIFDHKSVSGRSIARVTQGRSRLTFADSRIVPAAG
jgi:hypothetical protein